MGSRCAGKSSGGARRRDEWNYQSCGSCCRRLRPLLLIFGLLWLFWLAKGLGRICRLIGRDRDRPPQGLVPAWAYRQPDPMIYSQQYLISQGVAVTWDNPDITVELASAPGVPVDKHALLPDSDYLVTARIWNGSTTAPAPGMPVAVSFLSFGVNTTRTAVGVTTVDLPVKAAPGCPAFATVPWHTPATPGHYCLQVELLWTDDENPANNMGQSNTDVKPLNSPHAAFTFPVTNDQAERALVTMTVDSYEIPPLDPCGETRDNENPLASHGAEAWPVPDGWTVDVSPAEMVLAPGAAIEVTVNITAPDGFGGRQAFNVNARIGDGLLGGVTLYVDG
jgi:hypothetical protein